MPRRLLSVHRWTAAVLAIGLAGVAATAIAVGRTVSSDENQILLERAGETGTVIDTLVSSLQSSLTAVAAATEADPDAASALSAVAASPAGRTFAGLALLGGPPGAPVTVARHGSLLAVPGSLPRATGASQGTLTLTGLVGSGPDRRLGVLLGPPQTPAGTAIYAEVPLPQGAVTTSSDPMTQGIDFALYLGTESDSELLLTNATSRPLAGTRAVVTSVPGGTQSPLPAVDGSPGAASAAPGDLLLVVSPRVPLTSAFERALPWTISLLGLVLTLVFATLLETTLRRRDDALAFAAQAQRHSAALERATHSEQSALSALSESETSYSRLLQGLPQPMWMVDARTREFLDVNDAAVALFGRSREALLSTTADATVVDDDLPVLVDALDPPVGGGRPAIVRSRRGDGAVIDVEVVCNPLFFRGRDARFVIATDVTERERRQQRIQQSQRLESLGQLAGGVAHDFNNMLSVILSYAAFVDEEVERAGAARSGERWVPVRRDVQQIIRAAESASQLTHQLLAFARREVVAPRPTDVGRLVRSMHDFLARTIGEHVELTTTLATDAWPVNVDPGQLEQVVVNLVVNARDAMPRGGRVHIDTANVVVDDAEAGARAGLRPGRYVRLRVADTGVGMSREVVARAFEPFYTTKAKGEGTGLGLATVYGIVRQAGGHPEIYSEPGHGTTFSALLPVAAGAVSGPAEPVATPPPGHGERILVVEDDEAIRQIAVRMLERNGYEVTAAGTAEDAIRRAAEAPAPHDLLLTDVVMPRMLGREVADRVVAVSPVTRVLYMSGYAAEVLSGQGTVAADDTVLEKPFSEARLLGRVRDVLDARPRATSPAATGTPSPD